jgi:biofilm PGA synthesis N-glycosyltransferase PgaC
MSIGHLMQTIAAWFQAAFREWLEAAAAELTHLTSLDRFVVGLGEYALLFPVGMSVIWMSFALLFVLRRERRLPWSNDATLSVAVVVPARNEESGIASTIESLLSQDYPLMRIHVVSDASDDETAAIARTYESRGVIVHELAHRHGKAGGLQVALDAVTEDLFMVVDADTVCEPGAIRTMTQQFVDPYVGGVTGNPRVDHTGCPLTWIQSMEYMGIIGLIKRADSFWGGLFTVSGAAACFRTSALRAVGGWSGVSVTEDIELSWRLQKAGHELAYEPRALFAIQAPTSVGALYRQRKRWARGMWETLRLHGNLSATRNASLLPMAAQAIASVIWMVVTLATAGLWIVRAVTGLDVAGPFDPITAMKLLAFTSMLFVGQTALACLWESDYMRSAGRPTGWRFVPLALVFPFYYWLVIVPSFVAGIVGALRATPGGLALWERTARSASHTRPVPSADGMRRPMSRVPQPAAADR